MILAQLRNLFKERCYISWEHLIRLIIMHQVQLLKDHPVIGSLLKLKVLAVNTSV